MNVTEAAAKQKGFSGCLVAKGEVLRLVSHRALEAAKAVREKVVKEKVEKRSQQHPVFPGGHPSKY